MDPVPGAQSASGQISADGQFQWDGQQWVPLARNYRVPTPWTRPMQLATAGLLALTAVVSLVVTFAFYNHDSVVRALEAQGTQVPAGATMDTVVNAAIFVAYAVVVVFAILELVGAVGSYLGWRWIFWGVFVLFGLSSISALLGLGSLARASDSPMPFGGLVLSELLNLAGLVMFVWMIVALIKFGPWALKRPGT